MGEACPARHVRAPSERLPEAAVAALRHQSDSNGARASSMRSLLAAEGGGVTAHAGGMESGTWHVPVDIDADAAWSEMPGDKGAFWVFCSGNLGIRAAPLSCKLAVIEVDRETQWKTDSMTPRSRQTALC